MKEKEFKIVYVPVSVKKQAIKKVCGQKPQEYTKYLGFIPVKCFLIEEEQSLKDDGNLKKEYKVVYGYDPTTKMKQEPVYGENNEVVNAVYVKVAYDNYEQAYTAAYKLTDTIFDNTSKGFEDDEQEHRERTIFHFSLLKEHENYLNEIKAEIQEKE